MSYSHSTEALVLKTYDVGEADRFCILLTREKGRVAARASGVRKPGSRLGGLILPFRHLTMELRESGNSFVVAGAVPITNPPESIPLPSFYALSEGVELLLRLVTDEGELSEVFAATLTFFHGATREPSVLPTYCLALCHSLGLLPEDEASNIPLPPDAQALISASRRGECPPVPVHLQRPLIRFRDDILRMHLSSPLQSASLR